MNSDGLFRHGQSDGGLGKIELRGRIAAPLKNVITPEN